MEVDAFNLFKDGLNNDDIEIKVKTMNEFEKYCVLYLDEMSLESSNDYDVKSDSFIGKCTLPGLDPNTDATKVLTFMVGGLTTRWKMKIAYHFTGNSLDGALMGPVIMDILSELKKIDLKVIDITSDMGSPNLALWSK